MNFVHGPLEIILDICTPALRNCHPRRAILVSFGHLDNASLCDSLFNLRYKSVYWSVHHCLQLAMFGTDGSQRRQIIIGPQHRGARGGVDKEWNLRIRVNVGSLRPDPPCLLPSPPPEPRLELLAPSCRLVRIRLEGESLCCVCLLPESVATLMTLSTPRPSQFAP